jgi:hypothetical protein
VVLTKIHQAARTGEAPAGRRGERPGGRHPALVAPQSESDRRGREEGEQYGDVQFGQSRRHGVQELRHEERHEPEDAEGMAARAPAPGVHTGADDGEECHAPRRRVVVQGGRESQDRKAHHGQQRRRRQLSAHRGVGDREEGEQRRESSRDRAREGGAGRTAQGHRQADAEDGPEGAAQPQPARVRCHEHPLQHCFPAP